MPSIFSSLAKFLFLLLHVFIQLLVIENPFVEFHYNTRITIRWPCTVIIGCARLTTGSDSDHCCPPNHRQYKAIVSPEHKIISLYIYIKYEQQDAFTMIKYKGQCESLHFLNLYAQINLQCTAVYAVRTALMYPTYEECVRSAKKEYDLPSSCPSLHW